MKESALDHTDRIRRPAGKWLMTAAACLVLSGNLILGMTEPSLAQTEPDHAAAKAGLADLKAEKSNTLGIEQAPEFAENTPAKNDAKDAPYQSFQIRDVVERDAENARLIPTSDLNTTQTALIAVGEKILFDASDVASIDILPEPETTRQLVLVRFRPAAQERLKNMASSQPGRHLAIIADTRVWGGPELPKVIKGTTLPIWAYDDPADAEACAQVLRRCLVPDPGKPSATGNKNITPEVEHKTAQEELAEAQPAESNATLDVTHATREQLQTIITELSKPTDRPKGAEGKPIAQDQSQKYQDAELVRLEGLIDVTFQFEERFGETEGAADNRMVLVMAINRAFNYDPDPALKNKIDLIFERLLVRPDLTDNTGRAIFATKIDHLRQSQWSSALTQREAAEKKPEALPGRHGRRRHDLPSYRARLRRQRT